MAQEQKQTQQPEEGPIEASLKRLSLVVKQLETLADERPSGRTVVQNDLFAPLSLPALPQRPELLQMTQTIDRAIDRIENVLKKQKKPDTANRRNVR